MHLISIRNLRADVAKYPDAIKSINNWYSTVKKSQWQNLEDIRQIYRDAEAVATLDSSFKSGNPPNGLSRNFTVFNIKGNNYRLIVGIDYENQTVYYKYFLTHSEYDRDKWKNDSYF